ncbi:MAG: ABC transporter permease [Lachnospiraceae bacterium]|nr:ABC transporter permease [Lachnospiraceae bacterium]
MQVFKTFFRITWKYKEALLIYTGIFLVLMGMYASSETKNATKFETKKAKITIFDHDNSEASKYLTEYIKLSHDIVELEDSEQDIENAILYQKVDYVLYINEGYSKSGSLNNMKRSGTYIGLYVDNDISNFQDTMKALTEKGYSLEKAFDETVKLLNPEDLVEISGETKQKNMVYYFYLYIPYILLMLFFTGIGPVIMTFNKKEISNRTEISCLSIKKKTIQIIMGTLVLTVAMLVVFVLLSWIMCGELLFEEDFIHIILNAIAFTFVGIGMVSILSGFDLSMDAVNGISNIISLAMAFLGGIFVPMDLLGNGVKFISNFIPTHWYVVAHQIIFDGGSKTELYKCYGYQVLFGIVFLSIAMLIAKKNRIQEA